MRASGVNLATGEIHFFRPKVNGTSQEWTAHKMTPQMRELASYYIKHLYPPSLRAA